MRIEIMKAGIWEDITKYVMVQNCGLRLTFGNPDMRYAPDIFDFTIKGDAIDLIADFLETHLKTEIRVWADPVNKSCTALQIAQNDPDCFETLVFYGDVQADTRISLQNDRGNLSLSANDIAERLRDRPTATWAYIDEDLQTLARTICTFGGVPHDFPMELSAINVSYFVVEADDSKCLRELDTLLWEFGYTLYADPVRGLTVRSWWIRPGVLPVNLPEINAGQDGVTLEPVDIDEEELGFQILNVEWTIAGSETRDPVDIASDNCEGSGIRLYLAPQERINISAGEYYPAEGNLEKVFQRYNGRTAEELRGGDTERTRIIFGFDQCVNFVGDPEIVTDRIDHSAQQSRVLFRNSGSVAHELTRFEIRGSAIYSQGTAKSAVGIFTAQVDLQITAVTRGVNSVAYTFTNAASADDNFYNGYRLITPNGTNVIIQGYAGSPFYTAQVTAVEEVSPFDAAGDLANLISPTDGVIEQDEKADFIFSPQEGLDLAEGLKNARVFGRYSYRFAQLRTANPPRLGEYVNLRYDKYRIDVKAVVYEYNYTPDDIDYPRVDLVLRRVEVWQPKRAYGAGHSLASADADRASAVAGAAGAPGAGIESIYSTSDAPALNPGQIPDDNWGFQTPGTRGGTQWITEHPDQLI